MGTSNHKLQINNNILCIADQGLKKEEIQTSQLKKGTGF